MEQILGWAGPVALITSLASFIFVIFQVRKRAMELQKRKKEEEARVPATTRELSQALAEDEQKGAEQPKAEVLAPSGQSSGVEQLKQRHTGAN